MTFWQDVRLRLRALFTMRRADQELNDELRDHLELQARKHMRSGLDAVSARRRARIEFGFLESVKEECRDARRADWFLNFLKDLQLALRLLRRSPAFSLTAILIPAIGLGAATAVFSVVDRLLFRSLPYPQPDRIVSMGITVPWLEGEFLFSNDYLRLCRQQSNVFTALTSWTGIADCDLSELNPQRLTCAQVEWNVKNNGLSQPSDPEYYVLRKKITDLEEGRDAILANRSLHWYDGEVYFLVRSSAAPNAVANWIRSVAAGIDPTVPVAISTMQKRLASLSERPRFITTLLCFFAVASVFLAASGIYGLLSFLITQQTPEVGIRMAVGAAPFQIVFMLFKQVLYWSLTGALTGIVISALAVRSLRSLVFNVRIDNPVPFFLAACLMTGVALIATLLPSLRAARIDPAITLRRE